jgi:hypothetical protein
MNRAAFDEIKDLLGIDKKRFGSPVNCRHLPAAALASGNLRFAAKCKCAGLYFDFQSPANLQNFSPQLSRKLLKNNV